MRTLTTGTTTESTRILGSDPIIIIAIHWGSTYGTRYYSDYEFDLGGYHIQNRIIAFPALTWHQTSKNYNTVNIGHVTLSDSDKHFKDILEHVSLDGIKIEVYQYFSTLSWTDKECLFTGYLTSPYTWDESSYSCNLTFASTVKTSEIGFRLPQESTTYLSHAAGGKNYYFVPDCNRNKSVPTCFGKPLLVPGVKAVEALHSKIEHEIRSIASGPNHPATYEFTIENGHLVFPIIPDPATSGCSTLMDFCVGGMFLRGKFTGGADSDVFNVQNYFNDDSYTISGGLNAVKYNYQSTIEVEDWVDLESDYFDEAQVGEYTSIVLKENKARLAGYWCLMECVSASGDGKSIYAVNYCIDQYETYCLFKFPWTYLITNPSNPNNPLEVKFRPLSGDKIIEVRRFYYTNWSSYPGVSGGIAFNPRTDRNNPALTTRWHIPAGTPIYLVNQVRQPGENICDYPDTYIINSKASTNIPIVYGKKKVGKYNHLVQLNDDRWVSNNKSDLFTAAELGLTVAPTCTTLELKEPLWVNQEEDWDLETLWANVNAGTQNTATQLKEILDNYTSYTTDATFTSVASLLTNYPSNFAILKESDALKECVNIAWQARCSLTIDGTTIGIKYLSQEPDSDFTINEADIEEGGLQTSTEEATDCVNFLVANWRETLTDHRPQNERRVIVKDDTSIEAVGKKEEEYDFYIYNIESLVKKSATFWLNRMSKSWRTVTVKTFLKHMAVQPFDCVTLALPNVQIIGTGASIKCVVTGVDYDLMGVSIGMALWLPIECGTHVQSASAWLSDVSDTLPTDPIDNVQVVDVKGEMGEIVDPGMLGTGPGSIYNYQITQGVTLWQNLLKNVSFKDLDTLHYVAGQIGIKCMVTEHHGDHLTCIPYFGNVAQSQKIYVAKPFQLRRSPFDYTLRLLTPTANGFKDERRNTLKYVYDSDVKRRVYVLGQDNQTGGIGYESEAVYQIMLPMYMRGGTILLDDMGGDVADIDESDGDFIFARFCPMGTGAYISGKAIEQITDDIEALWLDLNVDARQWVNVTKKQYASAYLVDTTTYV